ncbi:hypothetical protein F9461_19040 [Escherichia coli]|uniref:Uncharacterized protein n=1 Tax=Escherichia coli TaxID=562 RepID=A0A8S7RXT8_ECOLX|nr:hypothetical protein [Escherichia coli]
MSEKKTTYCQVALSDKANDKLGKFQMKLKEKKNIKMSKAEVINTILEAMTMAEFDKVSSAVGVSAKAREKIMRIYENSNMTKEDLEQILSKLP